MMGETSCTKRQLDCCQPEPNDGSFPPKKRRSFRHVNQTVKPEVISQQYCGATANSPSYLAALLHKTTETANYEISRSQNKELRTKNRQNFNGTDRMPTQDVQLKKNKEWESFLHEIFKRNKPHQWMGPVPPEENQPAQQGLVSSETRSNSDDSDAAANVAPSCIDPDSARDSNRQQTAYPQCQEGDAHFNPRQTARHEDQGGETDTSVGQVAYHETMDGDQSNNAVTYTEEASNKEERQDATPTSVSATTSDQDDGAESVCVTTRDQDDRAVYVNKKVCVVDADIGDIRHDRNTDDDMNTGFNRSQTEYCKAVHGYQCDQDSLESANGQEERNGGVDANTKLPAYCKSRYEDPPASVRHSQNETQNADIRKHKVRRTDALRRSPQSHAYTSAVVCQTAADDLRHHQGHYVGRPVLMGVMQESQEDKAAAARRGNSCLLPPHSGADSCPLPQYPRIPPPLILADPTAYLSPLTDGKQRPNNSPTTCLTPPYVQPGWQAPRGSNPEAASRLSPGCPRAETVICRLGAAGKQTELRCATQTSTLPSSQIKSTDTRQPPSDYEFRALDKKTVCGTCMDQPSVGTKSQKDGQYLCAHRDYNGQIRSVEGTNKSQNDNLFPIPRTRCENQISLATMAEYFIEVALKKGANLNGAK